VRPLPSEIPTEQRGPIDARFQRRDHCSPKAIFRTLGRAAFPPRISIEISRRVSMQPTMEILTGAPHRILVIDQASATQNAPR
jgi:hypothetical protein